MDEDKIIIHRCDKILIIECKSGLNPYLPPKQLKHILEISKKIYGSVVFAVRRRYREVKWFKASEHGPEEVKLANFPQKLRDRVESVRAPAICLYMINPPQPTLTLKELEERQAREIEMRGARKASEWIIRVLNDLNKELERFNMGR